MMVAAVRKMKGKKNENATKNSNINSKKIRSSDVKYVSAYFNTVGGENVIIIPKRKLNENKVETSTNVKYVSGYFDYSRISSEDVIVIPPKNKKNETVGSVSPYVGMSKYCNVKPLKSLKPELRSDAYKRKTPNITWKPPKSTKFGGQPLLQEAHVYDPWRVLIISILLNVTTGQQVRQVLSDVFDLCPDAKSCAQVPVEEIEKVIRSLGLQNKRPKMLKRLSQQYLYGSWTHVTQLHGVGKYVGDAYAIFCTGEWRNIIPEDKELLPYWNLLWSLEQLKTFDRFDK